MSPVISQEVETAIQNLKNNRSGLHKISILVLKEVKSTISKFLSDILTLYRVEHYLLSLKSSLENKLCIVTSEFAYAATTWNII